MFKYPDNIIVNWLRSKMQGKIDLLQEQVDNLEKNYFDTEKIIEYTSDMTYEIISSDSFSSDTTGATTSAQHISFEILPNAFDYIGKELFIFSKYSATNTNFSTFQLGRYAENNSYTLLNTFYGGKRSATPYGIIGYYKFSESDFTESQSRLGIRFNLNQSGYLENQITFSDILVRII